MAIIKRFKNAYKAFTGKTQEIELNELLNFLGLKDISKGALSELHILHV